MPMSTSWSSAHQTSRPACQNTEVRFKPFVALIIRVLDLWAPPPPLLVLMGTSAPFNEPPGSPLSTGRSGVNSRGERSQDHRLHNASDCWLLMLKRALRGGVWPCVYTCICLHFFDCARIYPFVHASSCERMRARFFFPTVHPSSVYVCAHACQTHCV